MSLPEIVRCYECLVIIPFMPFVSALRKTEKPN
nr:MAG TPA: hypothetical protein [Microviridae sp.]